jgi:hypothetical protein
LRSTLATAAHTVIMSANDYEKNNYAVEGAATPPSDHGIKGIVESRGAATGEAADLYGSVEQAEQYGYVKRGYAILQELIFPEAVD